MSPLPSASCVTSDKSPPLSEPQSPHLERRNTHLQGLRQAQPVTPWTHGATARPGADAPRGTARPHQAPAWGDRTGRGGSLSLAEVLSAPAAGGGRREHQLHLRPEDGRTASHTERRSQAAGDPRAEPRCPHAHGAASPSGARPAPRGGSAVTGPDSRVWPRAPGPLLQAPRRTGLSDSDPETTLKQSPSRSAGCRMPLGLGPRTLRQRGDSSTARFPERHTGR